MAIGLQSKEGVIIKSEEGFTYYKSPNEAARADLYMPDQPNRRIKTLKVDHMVEIANNYVSVRVYPDGRIEVEPSKESQD